MDVNNNGVMASVPVAGSCAIMSNGRGTLALNGAVQQFAIYPTASHGMLMLELDSRESGIGTALSQTPGITASAFSGNYVGSFQRQGFINSALGGVGPWDDLAGVISSDGVSNLTGTVDIDQLDESSHAYWAQTPDVTATGNYTTDSQGNVTGSLVTGPMGTMPQNFYVVNGSTVLSLETDNTPAAGILQLQTF
jgi:hypothetical protein